jgi:hypothetical protein
MKVYIDSYFHCHTTNPDSAFREVETDFFDGKCDTFIEGYRFVPAGETWVRSDGKVFNGEMITPWKDYNELAAAQSQYELMMAETEAAYQEGVNSAYDQ